MEHSFSYYSTYGFVLNVSGVIWNENQNVGRIGKWKWARVFRYDILIAPIITATHGEARLVEKNVSALKYKELLWKGVDLMLCSQMEV